ncbi:MAG: GNAT family N-acetyltransferase, partial [Verrucomicrobiota bacterium]
LGDPRLLRLLGEVAKDEDVGFHFSRLTSQSDILAFDFGFVRGGSYYGYLTGFHPAFQKLAPGKCLLLRRIDEWVRKDKIHTLDFLAGDEGYKRDYTGGASYAVCSVHLMPDTFAHRARKASLVVARQGRQVAKQAIEKVSLAR